MPPSPSSDSLCDIITNDDNYLPPDYYEVHSTPKGPLPVMRFMALFCYSSAFAVFVALLVTYSKQTYPETKVYQSNIDTDGWSCEMLTSVTQSYALNAGDQVTQTFRLVQVHESGQDCLDSLTVSTNPCTKPDNFFVIPGTTPPEVYASSSMNIAISVSPSELLYSVDSSLLLTVFNTKTGTKTDLINLFYVCHENKIGTRYQPYSNEQITLATNNQDGSLFIGCDGSNMIVVPDTSDGVDYEYYGQYTDNMLAGRTYVTTYQGFYNDNLHNVYATSEAYNCSTMNNGIKEWCVDIYNITTNITSDSNVGNIGNTVLCSVAFVSNEYIATTWSFFTQPITAMIKTSYSQFYFVIGSKIYQTNCNVSVPTFIYDLSTDNITQSVYSMVSIQEQSLGITLFDNGNPTTPLLLDFSNDYYGPTLSQLYDRPQIVGGPYSGYGLAYSGNRLYGTLNPNNLDLFQLVRFGSDMTHMLSYSILYSGFSNTISGWMTCNNSMIAGNRISNFNSFELLCNSNGIVWINAYTHTYYFFVNAYNSYSKDFNDYITLTTTENCAISNAMELIYEPICDQINHLPPYICTREVHQPVFTVLSTALANSQALLSVLFLLTGMMLKFFK